MISQTYGDVKAELARVCGTSGMPVTDGRMLERANQAIMELANEGAWPGVVDRWHIRAEDGRIVLPSYLDMLLEFSADGAPISIRSPWAEFVEYGPGPARDLLANCCERRWFRCGGGNLYDRGEYPTQVSIPISDGSAATTGPWVLRLYANPATNETPGIFATIQGLDPDGLIIRSEVDDEWINGVRLGITSGSGFTETTQEFSDVKAFTKPATNGYVRLTAWNGTTEVQLSNYEPAETTPSYHRYYSPYLQSQSSNDDACCKIVLARARKRFVPIREDTDVLMISNVLALKSIMIAQWKREAGNYEAYAAMKLTAVDIMRKEAMAYRGKTRAPTLTFQRGFSLGGDIAAIR